MALDMTLEEIEHERYRNELQIRSIEAEIERVNPFSEDFEMLVEESLRLQEAQKMLFADRAQKLIGLNMED